MGFPQGRSPGPPRQPLARHGKLRSPHPVSQVLSVLGAALAVLLTSVTGIGTFTLLSTASAIADNAVVLEGDDEVPPSLGAIEGGVNVLVVGTDSCEGQDLALFPRCANSDSPGERNDVTMLVHISDDPRRVTVVSFPRDMLVPIPACPNPEGGEFSAMSSQPINATYGYGGLACTVKTVEELTGEDIQFAAAIRWTGVIHMSDAIGGVDVCVSGDISDKHTGLSLAAGEHTLQGVQALQFLRIRHGIGDGSDLGRISNQQQFMSSLVRKLQSGAVLGNAPVLFNLATTAMAQVTQGQLVLSSGLANPTAMVQIAMAVKSVPYKDIVFVQYPTAYRSGDGRSDVVPVRDAADVLFAALRDNLPLELTGEASQGFGVEVTGEVDEPEPSSSPTPSITASDEPTSTADPSAPAEAPDEERVDLPSDIAGQTAAQVTCTRPES